MPREVPEHESEAVRNADTSFLAGLSEQPKMEDLCPFHDLGRENAECLCEQPKPLSAEEEMSEQALSVWCGVCEAHAFFDQEGCCATCGADLNEVLALCYTIEKRDAALAEAVALLRTLAPVYQAAWEDECSVTYCTLAKYPEKHDQLETETGNRNDT